MRQQHFLWAWWIQYIKLCTSTQNVSGKIISFSCCFQHVTHIFVGSFLLWHQTRVTCLHFTGLSCLVFTLSSLHCWLADSCLQPTSDTYVQHPLVKFSDKHLSLSSHATGQVWEAPAVNSLKAISSLLCFKSQSMMPTGAFTADVLQALPVMTVKLVFLHFSWRKFHLYCFHLYETFCFMYVLLLCGLLWQRL